MCFPGKSAMSYAVKTDPAQGGFTLLEVLVALVIFAIASLIAFGGLNAVMSTKSSLDREIRFWRELGLVFDRMESDFVQILPRMGYGSDGEIVPPFRAGMTDDSGFYIELSRFDDERIPVRAIYRCSRNELVLSIEPITRTALRSATRSASESNHPMLKDIEQCDAAFLASDNSWRSIWPGEQMAIKPRAVRIGLTLAGRGRFERIYYLP